MAIRSKDTEIVITKEEYFEELKLEWPKNCHSRNLKDLVHDIANPGRRPVD